MRWVRRLIGVALVVLFMVGGWKLAAENDSIVPVRYLWGVIDLRLWQALGIAFGLGLGIASLGWSFSGLRSGMVQRRYRKTVKSLESEVHQLRNLPLNPEVETEAPALPPRVDSGSDERSG